MPLCDCGCGEEIPRKARRIKKARRLLSSKGTTDSNAQPGAPAHEEAIQPAQRRGPSPVEIKVMDSSEEDYSERTAVRTDNSPILAYYYISQVCIVHMKAYKWGNRYMQSFSCSRCAACWILQFDARSASRASGSTSIELVGGESDAKAAEPTQPKHAPSQDLQEQIQQHPEPAIVQTWKLMPTYVLHDSEVLEYTCFKCTAQWKRS